MPFLSPERAASLTDKVDLQEFWTGALGKYPKPKNHGPVPGVLVGSLFSKRKDLFDAGVHRQLQAGICGTAKEGAESIVVSGGYADDADYGDWMIYTGQGGRDPESGVQIRDQEVTLGNAALVTSYVFDLPVRVIRGSSGDPNYSPRTGYRYDGLFEVEHFWDDIGKAGFRVWRYQLRRISENDALPDVNFPSIPIAHEPTQPEGNQAPDRRTTVTQRVVRSTRVAEWVKAVHNYKCQICKELLETPRGPYAEAAHIQPIGKPHSGPDTVDNILCLCANHHVLFDAGALWVTDDLMVIDHQGNNLGPLRTQENHQINRDHLLYHRTKIAKVG